MLEGQDDKSSNITKKKSIGFFGGIFQVDVCVLINHICLLFLFSIFMISIYTIHIYTFEQ